MDKSKTILNKESALKLYTKAGVNESSANLFVNYIGNLMGSLPNKAAQPNIGDFAGLFDLKKTSYIDPLLVASSDGVGSKILLAIAANKHDTIGIDLVAMCVNDLVTKGAEPLFFLDYFAVNKLIPNRDTQILKSIVKGCNIAGCTLLGGETAQLAKLYRKNEYDLAAFALGAVERDRLLPQKRLKSGDIIIGLESSGIHANGFSLINKLIKMNSLDIYACAPFDINNNKSLAELLLTPTRIYVKPILAALKHFLAIKAIAHITGGGFFNNLPRILPQQLNAKLYLAKFPALPIFKWLAANLNLSDEAMLSIFNCGIGLVLIVEHDKAKDVQNFLSSMGESTHIIGELIDRNKEDGLILTDFLR